MSDAPDETPATEPAEDDGQEGTSGRNSGGEADEAGGDEAGGDEAGDLESLREQVEQKYDFDDFGPQEMAEMSPEEWEAAFDAEAWITGPDLLDRVEADLRSRVAARDVFAVVERATDPPRLVAYSDKSYAIVYADGTIEGEGAVLRDVKPTVALASMPEYEVPDAPADAGLPSPEAIDAASSSLGNLMLQLVGGALLVSALALFGATLFADLGGATIVAVVVGFVFLLVGVGLTFTVANARLSSRYRAEEYRDRLRGAGVEQGERPAFLPVDEEAFEASGPALRDGDDTDGEPSPGTSGDGSDDEPAPGDPTDTDDATTDGAGDTDAGSGTN